MPSEVFNGLSAVRLGFGFPLCRQKERRAAARRSEQQERARQQAAHKLMQRQGGWLAQFGRNLESAFNGVRSSVDRSMDDNYDDSVPQVLLPALLSSMIALYDSCTASFRGARGK